LFLLIVVGCHDKDNTGNINYLNNVIDLMEMNSINRKTINWIHFRSDVIASANGAETDVDVNPALRTALTKLGDHHSFITRGNTTIFGEDLPACTGCSNGVVNKPANIGYLKVPGYTGTDVQFAIGLQNKIREQDSQDIIGWIVDLRGNTGGNMYPMIAGVGPILGNDICGFFVDPDGDTSPYSYFNGFAQINSAIIINVPNPYTLLKQDPKVAVLFDNQTASSGEATAIAFIGRPNTRSFGVSTCGLSTANMGFDLTDGGKLQLTVAFMADRNENKKGGPLVPDVTVAGDQAVVDKAAEWINEP